MTGTPISTYEYDTAGRAWKRTDAQANLRWERTYEPNTGRLDTQVIKNHSTGAALASFDLGYDAADNVASKSSSVFSNPANGTWGFVYDGASRLIQATGPNAVGAATTYDYAYDGAGNRILAKETTGSVVKNLATTYDAAGLPTSATDAATGESVTYAHDAIGNVTGIDSSIAANDWTYTFDPFSRLTCAVQGSTCGSGSTRVLFTLDALDRATTRVKGSSTTSLTYRGIDEVLAKVVNGSTTTLYDSTASGTPIAEKTGSTSSFYLRDPHGDVVGLASSAAANQGTSAFDPWGRSLATTGQTSFLGYQSDMTDADTKQVDMGTRWYAGSLGRFTARDVLFGELESPMTLNQHVYGGLNPMTMWDPTGMRLERTGGGGGGVWFFSGGPRITIVSPRPPASWRADRLDMTPRNPVVRPIRPPTTHRVAPRVSSPISRLTDNGPRVRPLNSAPQATRAVKDDLLRPGPWARESVPASSTGRATLAQQAELNRIGGAYGCHSCGARTSGVKSGNWIGDHQPATRTVPSGTPQVLYPHCQICSNEQGLWIINLIRQGL